MTEVEAFLAGVSLCIVCFVYIPIIRREIAKWHQRLHIREGQRGL